MAASGGIFFGLFPTATDEFVSRSPREFNALSLDLFVDPPIVFLRENV